MVVPLILFLVRVVFAFDAFDHVGNVVWGCGMLSVKICGSCVFLVRIGLVVLGDGNVLLLDSIACKCSELCNCQWLLLPMYWFGSYHVVIIVAGTCSSCCSCTWWTSSHVGQGPTCRLAFQASRPGANTQQARLDTHTHTPRPTCAHVSLPVANLYLRSSCATRMPTLCLRAHACTCRLPCAI
jgi:hypothetical protein